MNNKEFRRLIIGIVVLGTVWMIFLWHMMHPNPLVAVDPDNGACCSEETMISIFEGTDDLEEIYNVVMEHVYKRDSINHNGVEVIRMWEDSLAKESAESLSTKPVLHGQ